MAQKGLGGSGGSLVGFRGSCCPLEGSEDVPEVSWGAQGVLMWVWGVLEPSRRSGGVPERPWGVQRVLLLIHGVRRFIQKGLEMSKKDRVGSRGSPGVPRASLQSSRRVWGCFREDLECLGGPWVGSVVFWKGLKMSQECLGVSKVCSCGSGGSWSHPEGSGDVPERTGRVWAVLRWVQRVLLSSGRV